MSKDYYDILGVDRNASKDDIKKAYKKLAKKYHPDKHQDSTDKKDAEEKFKEINEAAAVLGDEQKRTQFDQFGKSGPGFDFRDFGGFNNFGADFDFGDIFDMFFGGGGGFGRGRRRSHRGSDLRFDIELDLEEVAEGVQKTIMLPRLEKCHECNGSGAKSSSDIVTCHTCQGSGRVTRSRRTPFGIFQTTTTCNECKGEGKIIKNPCKPCRGSGRVNKNSKIKINIPAGVEHGTRLRISGEGEAGVKGVAPGDLYVVVHVKEHEYFIRDGDDLYVDIPISFTQASLGDVVEVATLDGKTKLKIPSGTQTDTIFRLKNKGIPHLNGYGRGDQKIRVIVQVPKRLNKKQTTLLREFEKESGSDSNPVKSFFKNIFDKI